MNYGVKKKFAAFVMSASLLAAMSGCSSGSQSVPNGISQTSGQTSGLKGKIRIFIANPERTDAYAKIVEMYNAKNPDVTIEVEAKDMGQYYSTLSTALQSDDMPDLFVSHGSKTPSLQSYIKAGAVLDLDQYISKEDLKVFDPYLIQRAYVNGKLYAMPGSFLDTWPIFYNKDIFKQNNLKVPQTWDELKTIMQTLTDKGITAMSLPGKDVKGPATIVMNMAHSMEPGWVDEMVHLKYDGNFPNGKLGDPRNMAVYNEFLRWIDAGYFGKNWKALDTNGGIMEFTSGKAAMWWRGSYDKNAITANKDIQVGAFYPPTKDGKISMISGQDTVSGFSVYSKTKNVNLAIDVLKFFTSKEAAQVIADMGLNIPGRTDITSKDPVFQELTVREPEVRLPLYCDYFGVTARENVDTWVEYKKAMTNMAFKQFTPEQAVKYMEDNVIDYTKRNLNPWNEK